MKNYREVVIGPYSAYQIAVKHGFVGTEEDWLKSVERDRLAAEAAAEKAKEYINADATLTISGAPADAKAVGDRINAIRVGIDKTLTISDAAADAAAVGMRLRMLEVILGIPGDGNTFMTTFDTLDGVALEGVWNKPLCRVEF